ncbi:MAG: hypothetical protein ABI378_06460 [Chitinophagaceae bacterium]
MIHYISSSHMLFHPTAATMMNAGCSTTLKDNYSEKDEEKKLQLSHSSVLNHNSQSYSKPESKV